MKFKPQHWAIFAFLLVTVFLVWHGKLNYSNTLSATVGGVGGQIMSSAWM